MKANLKYQAEKKDLVRVKVSSLLFGVLFGVSLVSLNFKFPVITVTFLVLAVILIITDHLWIKSIGKVKGIPPDRINEGMRDQLGFVWRHIGPIVALIIVGGVNLLALPGMPLEPLLPEGVSALTIFLRSTLLIVFIVIFNWWQRRSLIRGKYSKKELFQ